MALSRLAARLEADAMPAALPPECLRLLDSQDGVITVGQAVSAGVPAKAVRAWVRAGRWQVMQRGVYAAFNGRPARRAELWAVLLRAGPEAVLSHQAAAELWGLLDGPSPVIHVTVPHDSNPERRGPIPGVVIHRSRSLERARHPVLTPPRTRWTSNGVISAATAGTRCTKGSRRSGSGCLT
jgi:Transcriptional regulator, AbiEi antitoxin